MRDVGVVSEHRVPRVALSAAPAHAAGDAPAAPRAVAARAGPCRTARPRLHPRGLSIGRSLCDRLRSDAPRARCIGCSPRPTKLRHPAFKPARRDGSESGLVLGHHQAERPDALSLLLAVCDPRPLQLLRRGLDERRSRRAHTRLERLILQTCAKQRIQPKQLTSAKERPRSGPRWQTTSLR